MNRSKALLKLLAVALPITATFLGVVQQAEAYRYCPPNEAAVCNAQGTAKVVCLGSSGQPYCFNNMCFARCAGFSTSVCYQSPNCQWPLPLEA